MEEIRVAYLLHRLNSSKDAPSGYDVLKMATMGSARLLGREKEIGSVEEGKCADLFMIRKNRTELVGACEDPKSLLGTVGWKRPVDMTIINGHVTVRDGVLTGVDEEALAIKAESEMHAYLARQ